MDLQTLKKLQENPHYKLSVKQKAQLAREQRKPMVEFHRVKKHDNKIPRHKPLLKKPSSHSNHK